MIRGGDYADMDGNPTPPIDQTGMRFAFARLIFTWADKQGAHHVGVDPTHARDRDAWYKSGRAYGGYLILGWAKDGPTPEEQAQAFIRAHGPRRDRELAPSLDLEADDAKSLGRTPAECLAWAERAYAVLKAYYGTVIVYTSDRVWIDVFGDAAATTMSGCPLWVKVPYPRKVRTKAAWESCPTPAQVAKQLPRPWRSSTSAGAWIVQFQGDALGAAGFPGVVDLDAWLSYSSGTGDARDTWVKAQLAARGAADVPELQRARGLGVDNVVGPATFPMLC